MSNYELDDELQDLSIAVDDDLDLFGSADFDEIPEGDGQTYNNEEIVDDVDDIEYVESDLFDDIEYENIHDDSDLNDIQNDDFEDDIDDETEKFVKALTLTLRLRSNPMDAEGEELFKTRYRGRSISKSKMEKQVNIMKDVLDLVQKYNQSDSHDVSMLPEGLAETVTPNGLIQYDNKDNTVWNVAYHRMRCRAEGNMKLLNKITSNATDLKNTFGLLCEFYNDADSKFFDMKKSKPNNDRINRKRFAFYHECLNRLNKGERVALCRSLIFDKYDRFKYKFKCGSCGRYVFGSRVMQYNDGSVIKEGNTHNFYQVITLNGRGLHYPLVCEECDAINCLPSVIRDDIDNRIDAQITESSHDKNEYVRKSNQKDGKTVVSDSRRSVPYEKWLDMLDHEIESGEFNIDSDSIFDSDDGLIVDVTDEDYRIAIQSFRKMNNMLNKKIELDKKGLSDIDFVLASIASKGTATILKDACSHIASYIVDTATFRELSMRKHNKDNEYDRYLQFCALQSGMHSGEISEMELSNIKMKVDVELTEDSISRLCEEYCDSYKACRDEYEAYRDKMVASYKLLAFSRKDRKDNALSNLCDVMENNLICLKFVLNVLCETLSTEAFNNMKTSFNMKVDGKRISNMVKIKQSRIRDKEHMRIDRYTLMKTYLKELIKRDYGYKKGTDERYVKIYKDVGSLIDKFDIDFYWYHKYCEWRDMFSLSDNDKVDELVNNPNSGAIFKSYYDKMCTPYRNTSYQDIKNYYGHKLSDIKPDFINSDYFKIIFNITDEDDNRILRDMSKAINNILNFSNFQVYDIIFSKLMISYVGLKKFTGFTSVDVASKVSMTGGLVEKLYDDCKADVDSFVSRERRKYTTIVRLSNHDFVFRSNYSGNTEILTKYINILNGEDTDSNESNNRHDGNRSMKSKVETEILDELNSCIDRIRNEFRDADYLDDEFCFIS